MPDHDNKDDRRDYRVGYGKPPKHTQFLPGTSGFQGRSRKRKRLEPQAAMIARLRDELVTVGGKTMTKFELAFMQVINQTIKSGKPRDLKLLMDMLKEFGALPEAESHAETRAGADAVMKKIDMIVHRTLNLDPADTRIREQHDEEEAILIMNCPHCSAALRERWAKEDYKEFTKRHNKSTIHRQIEEAIKRRERRK